MRRLIFILIVGLLITWFSKDSEAVFVDFWQQEFEGMDVLSATQTPPQASGSSEVVPKVATTLVPQPTTWLASNLAPLILGNLSSLPEIPGLLSLATSIAEVLEYGEGEPLTQVLASFPEAHVKLQPFMLVPLIQIAVDEAIRLGLAVDLETLDIWAIANEIAPELNARAEADFPSHVEDREYSQEELKEILMNPNSPLDLKAMAEQQFDWDRSATQLLINTVFNETTPLAVIASLPFGLTNREIYRAILHIYQNGFSLLYGEPKPDTIRINSAYAINLLATRLNSYQDISQLFVDATNPYISDILFKAAQASVFEFVTNFTLDFWSNSPYRLRRDAFLFIPNLIFSNFGSSRREIIEPTLVKFLREYLLENRATALVIEGLQYVASAFNTEAATEAIEVIGRLLYDTDIDDSLKSELRDFLVDLPTIRLELREVVQEVLMRESLRDKFQELFGIEVVDDDQHFPEEVLAFLMPVFSSLPGYLWSNLRSLVARSQPEHRAGTGPYHIEFDFNRFFLGCPANPINNLIFDLQSIASHEIAHIAFFARHGKEEFRELHQQSTDKDDFVPFYNSYPPEHQNIIEDHGATFQAYFENSQQYIQLARSIAERDLNPRTTLLKKFSVIAQLFSFDALDGTRHVFVYELCNNGIIIRQEVALAEQEINGETYLLPDFNQIYKTEIFE